MYPTLTDSVAWWQKIKHNPELLLDWLLNQYHGEITAHARIMEFAEEYTLVGSRERAVLGYIADQELDHASWVGDLLIARGITPSELKKPERYWNTTLAGITNFETGAAVAAHAEFMRLERIREIAADEYAPSDIRAVFTKILPQEVFHERAFRRMAGNEAMQKTLAAHQRGREAIGLIPEIAA